MVDSDSVESDSNGSKSCWKWNFRCLALFSSTSPIRRLRHVSSQEIPSADSLETAETDYERNQCDETSQYVAKEQNLTATTPSRKLRQQGRSNSIGDISQGLYDSPHPNPNQLTVTSSVYENSQSRNSAGFLHFLGLHFTKSETRHLDRTVFSNSNQSEIDKLSRKAPEECRYTKLPLSCSSASKSTPLTRTNTNLGQTSSSLFHIQIQGRKVEKSSKHLKGKSKSDNNLHRVTIQNLQSSNLSTSSSRVENEYCDHQGLNSVQTGDHASISLPWAGLRQNNLSSVTTQKSHPNTHNNINSNFLQSTDSEFLRNPNPLFFTRKGSESESLFNPIEQRQRSKSLERTSNIRISSSCSSTSSSINFPKTSDRFSERANSLECHPHRRVRKTLNPKEQEILLRHISKETTNLRQEELADRKVITIQTVKESEVPVAKQREKSSLVSSNIVTGQGLNPSTVLSRVNPKPSELLPDKLTSSAQNSPRSPSGLSNTSSPGAYSCPPSPPPRPASTLKTNRSRLISQNSTDKAKAPSPSSATSLTLSAFPFPPIMNSNAQHQRHRLPSPLTSPTSTSTNHHRPTDAEAMETTVGALSTVEEARNSGFINKPMKGWLHSDKLLTKEGVTYAVRYIGCHDVNTSMKSLDFDTRSLIAKECINQVCEAAGFKSIDKRRKIDRRLVKILGTKPRLEHAGSDVCLTITSTCLKLTSLESRGVIAVHEMPNISFASGGDVTMLDFVAYVAKDAVVGRACFVLECGSGLAQDVITTIGQAFELRFKEYLQKRPPPLPRAVKDDPEYYNDLPGKLPPEHSPRGDESIRRGSMKAPSNGHRTKPTPTLTLEPSVDKEMPVNLIDFEAPTPPAFGQMAPEKTLENLLLGRNGTEPNDANTGGNFQDPFDMQPLNGSLKSRSIPMSIIDQRTALEAESWFHGVISRGEAEALVVNDGDFLVRESQTSPHQYVLTGLQNGSAKHLLLVDPEGVVRTKDRTFESITHLIHHHSDSSRPIISAESMVLLRTPVLRTVPIP